MPYSHPQPIDRSMAVRQISHLVPGALAFASTAGFINSVGLGFFRTPVSHMTGAVSRLGLDLAESRIYDATASLSIVVGFLTGAVVIGILVGAKKLMPGRRYAVAVIVEGGLVFIAMKLLIANHRLGLPLISMACGLQNAMTSSYCGLVIRTTHVSGTVTDIGVMIGHWLRHREIDKWKFGFLTAVVAFFGAGSWMGAIADRYMGPASLSLVAGGCLIMGGLLWILAQKSWFTGNRQIGEPVTSSFPAA